MTPDRRQFLGSVPAVAVATTPLAAATVAAAPTAPPSATRGPRPATPATNPGGTNS